MPFPIAGVLGGLLFSRAGMAIAGGSGVASRFYKLPLVQGGQFGVGYTGGAYLGYGTTNTADPFGLHKPKYRYNKQSLGLPYSNSYGRRRYSRYSGYTRYGRSSYYRRRRPYYRRRSYY